MKSPTTPIRRSVSLPPGLVADAVDAAPEHLKENFNRLVRTALEEYIALRRAKELEEQMRAMAADPDVQREVAAIDREFRAAEADGLGGAR